MTETGNKLQNADHLIRYVRIWVVQRIETRILSHVASVLTLQYLEVTLTDNMIKIQESMEKGPENCRARNGRTDNYSLKKWVNDSTKRFRVNRAKDKDAEYSLKYESNSFSK